MTEPDPNATTDDATRPPAAPTPTDASPHVLPRQTTPTWEMELLISGLTVFALLQLPGVLDDWFQRAFVRMEREYAMIVMLFYMYVKSAVIALATTFSLHLALRGYWVALIGMRSVYPDGTNWERLRLGRQLRRVSQERDASMSTQIERADNRATVVFGLGVGFALVMLTPMLLVAVVFALTMTASYLLGPDVRWITIFGVANLVVVSPVLLATLVDRYAGRYIADDGVAARILRAILRVYAVFGLGRTSNALVAVFQSQIGARKGALALTFAMLLTFGFVFVQMMHDWGAIRLDTFRWLPRNEAGAVRALRPEHYAASRRELDRRSLAPYIQADILKDPYLRLTLPYDADEHNAAIARECPGVDPAVRDDAAAEATRRDALLACVARLHAVAIDGKPLPVTYDFAGVDGRERGFMAMIDVRDLPRGRHELTIAQLSSRRDRELGRTPPPYRIPFWR